MYAILDIGMTGQGKSHFVKNYIAGRACFVFDVNNEYQDLNTNVNATRARHIAVDENLFIKQCHAKKNTICVFEEATGFFEGRTSKDLRRLIVNKRHTGNVYIFLFHSISSVPPRLMQFCNYVVLHKTGDEPYQVETKYPTLYPYYLKLRTMPHQSRLIIKTIPQ
jgi:DNA helicase HerA-like ATPase